MEKGLGDLGFWLGLAIVLAAMIVSGALKERDKEREKQATLRALLERDRALVGRQGEGTTEILAYLREKDAEEAARAHAKRIKNSAETRIALAVLALVLPLMIGFMVLVIKPFQPMYPFPLRPGYPLQFPAPPPESGSRLLIAIGIWAAGLILATVILFWGRFGNKKNVAPSG